MHGGHEFLEALTLVLCVAGVTTLLFQRLRQPVVLGYILAGLIVGPYVPIPLVADRAIVETLSELGVIMLMFSLGLEFSLRNLVEVGPRASLTAIVQTSFMVWLGYLAGQAFGWTVRESLFTGAIVAISSTTIIAKAFDEQVLTLVVIAGKIVGVSFGASERQRDPHLDPIRDEPGADRRVFVHHRFTRHLAPGDRLVPVSDRGRRLGDHHADHALADPRLGTGRLVHRSAHAGTRCFCWR